jgi:triacylglycerol esterase/lipase EstA (alpha/beta hydrolase family)
LHNPSGWSAYLKRLKQEGLGPVYTLHLTHPFLSIRDYAEQVKQKAEEIEAKTQRKELALIGHSMGGVVSAFYASKLAPKGAVSHVITLGSPLHGSCLAKFFAVGPNGREMRVGSPLLQELREAIALKEGDIQFYHAGSAADELVPASSALLWRNPKRELRVSDLGHASLMTSQKVADWVCACLRSSA